MLRRRPAPLLTMAFGLGCLAFLELPGTAAALTAEAAPLIPLRASAPVTVVLHLSWEMRGAVRKLPTNLDEGPVVKLSIERVKAPGGATIRVFVNLPTANADTPASDFHYAGSMTAFEDPAPGTPGDDFLLDAGRVLKRLKKGDRLLSGDNVSVTLVLDPASAGADVAIPVERVALSIETQ
jgi:hypothetical protein